jgi:hypothetical protein
LIAGDQVVLALLASPMSRSTAGGATPASAIITVTPDDAV